MEQINPVRSSREELNPVFAKNFMHSSLQQDAGYFSASNGVKTALICQGGGMRAAFAAGAGAELGENLGVNKFDIVIGVSGSSTTASYYTSGQFSMIRKVWSENLGTTKLVNKKNIFKKENLVLLVLLAPYIFEIYAFYKGHAPFNIPEVPEPVGFDPPFFNVRLAIDVLPAVAVFIGLLTKKRIIQVILILLIIINSAMFLPYAGGKIPVLLDALNSEIPARQPTVKWINNNYQGGNILISSAVTDSIIRESGLNYGNFITEGSGKYWTESLKEPENYVKYIIMTSDPRDSIKNHADLNKINSKYNLVAEYYSVQIFKIR